MNTATIKRQKLSLLDKRAQDMCLTIATYGGMSFAVEWAKSKTWGLCPRIEWHGAKAAHASGCGYCKESTVLASALRFLGATDEAMRAIWRTGGAGVSSVQSALKAQGWELEKNASGKAFDSYTVRRVPITP